MPEEDREPGRGDESRVPFGLAEVHGPSMVPTLRHGDRLIVQYGARVRPGDVVILRHPFQQDLLVVKRAAERREGGWWVLADNAFAGGDSTDYGTVPEELVLGRVRARFRPWDRGGNPGTGAGGDEAGGGRQGRDWGRGWRSSAGLVGWLLSAARPVVSDRALSSRLRAR